LAEALEEASKYVQIVVNALESDFITVNNKEKKLMNIRVLWNAVASILAQPLELAVKKYFGNAVVTHATQEGVETFQVKGI
tara:strand:+ start:298 stop:540 length:243 start_codon:yes stop_codon:yes gene_type:complete